MAKWSSIAIAALVALIQIGDARLVQDGRKCTVYPRSNKQGTAGRDELRDHRSKGHNDDTSTILEAFRRCGNDGTIELPKGNTYHINQVMNTTGLRNCDIHIHGRMEWSKDINYWLSHSMRLDFQDLSTAWFFGGTNVSLYGHGSGVFFGNGQTWYDQNRNRPNQPGRPMSMVITNSTNLLIDGMTWLQSQFWSSFITYSHNVSMTNIYMNSTSNSKWGTVNTDGSDTWNADKVLYENWVVQNGDDCIAIKGNSTNIHGRNITCHGGGDGGMPIGSIGQYPHRPDFVENVTFTDVHLINTNRGAWIKTWPGMPRHGPENGDDGGGGGGYVKNVTFENFRMEGVNMPIYTTQCTYVEDAEVCDTSKLQLSDISWTNFTGTSAHNLISSIHCSGAAFCPGLRFQDINIKPLSGKSEPVYQCANLADQNSTFPPLTGIPCNAYAPGDFVGHSDRDVPEPDTGHGHAPQTVPRVKSGTVGGWLGSVDGSLWWALTSFWVVGGLLKAGEYASTLR